jgi:hypothetical protein
MSRAKVAGGVFLVIAGLGSAAYGVDEFELFNWMSNCVLTRPDCTPWRPYQLQVLEVGGVMFMAAALVAFVLGALLVWKGLKASEESKGRIWQLEERIRKLEGASRES